MSETDSFIQEVTEEVRQDQMLAYWKRYGPFVIGGIILIVGAAAAWNWMEAQERAAAEERGGIFLSTDQAAPETRFDLPERVDGRARMVAELTAAAALAGAGETEDAAALYAGIAAQDELPREYRDLAVLQGARIAAQDDPAAARGALQPLIDGAGPYRLMAMELAATLDLAGGSMDAAHRTLNAIIADPLATGSLRQRAGALLAATGGQAAGTDAN